MWIILDTFGGAECATVVTDEDGNNEQFDTEEEANNFISENLQEGKAVEIS